MAVDGRMFCCFKEVDRVGKGGSVGREENEGKG